MRRRLILLGFVIMMLTGVVSISATAQSRTVFWERWDVEITNIDTTNNSFQVREQYTIRFTGTFTFGTATILKNNLESIDNIQIYEAGNPLQASRRCNEIRGTFCTQSTQEGVSVVYYFNAPVTNTTREFTIEYTVRGALRVYEDGDQLWWIAVPEDKYGFSVGESTIRVEMPPGFAPRAGIDPVETYGAAGQITVEGRFITAQAIRGVGANEKFEIRVQYPHDPNARIASWQASWDDRRAFEENVKPLIDLGLITVSILIAIGGVLGVYALWYNKGRDPKVGIVPEYLSEPPSELPPAVVGTLLDEKADTRDILSTLIDLGRRGYLVIQEDKTQGFLGIGASSVFTFKRTDKPLTDLRKYEQRIMEKVFGRNLERSMESLKNKFYQYLPRLKEDLYGELVDEGLFTAKPSTTRALYNGFGMVILFVAAFTGFFALSLLETFTSTLICAPVAIGFVGVVMLLVGNHMPAKTRKGAEEAAKWEAFRQYLLNLEKYDTVEGVADKFDAYLPYAVAFGLDRSWIRRFSRVKTVGTPIWYYPTYRGGRYRGGYRAGSPLGGGLSSNGDMFPGEIARAGGGGLGEISDDMMGGLSAISDGLSNMLNSASRVFTSTPAPSSGSGSWSSGGRSWSGGGSFGGGGSGGGSRGFG
ncbi:MAG: DUF2207 domain-containing protein [Phototrophicales bacterium]